MPSRRRVVEDHMAAPFVPLDAARENVPSSGNGGGLQIALGGMFTPVGAAPASGGQAASQQTNDPSAPEGRQGEDNKGGRNAAPPEEEEENGVEDNMAGAFEPIAALQGMFTPVGATPTSPQQMNDPPAATLPTPSGRQGRNANANANASTTNTNNPYKPEYPDLAAPFVPVRPSPP
jgi:hypothetical protein